MLIIRDTIFHLSHEFFSTRINNSIFAYMVFVKDSMSTNEQNSPLMSHSHQEELSNKTFLDEYDSLFSDSISSERPPSHGDKSHNIELFPRISLPNKPP